jgi:hypothetical protein
VARYIESKIGDTKTVGIVEAKSDADHWLLDKLQRTIDGTAADLE